MKKGIVLEVDDEFVILLTPEGEFIKIKKEGAYEIGQEIGKVPMRRQKGKLSFFRYHPIKVALTSVVAVCLLVLTLFSNSASNEVYAYMSIDMNPSIELAVNEDLKVLNIKGYNQEGKDIVSRLSNWKEKKFVDITKEIIRLSMKRGYLQEGEEVLITTVEKEKSHSSAQQLTKELSEMKKSYQTKNIVVKTETSTVAVRNEAVKKGFTTGRFLRLTKKTEEQNRDENEQQAGEKGEELIPDDNVQKNQGIVPAPSQGETLLPKEQKNERKLNQPPSQVKEKEQQNNQMKSHVRENQPSSQFREKERRNNEMKPHMAERADRVESHRKSIEKHKQNQEKNLEKNEWKQERKAEKERWKEKMKAEDDEYEWKEKKKENREIEKEQENEE